MDWKVEKSEYIVSDQWIKVRADRCVMPAGVVLDPFYVVEHPDWVNVVAITPEQKVVMVKQYRHGIGRVVTELPAGCIDAKDGDPRETIERELLEETGYTADEFIFLSKMPLNSANHNNTTYNFLALNARKIQEPEPEETEQLETVLLSFDEVHQLIADGDLLGLHTANFLLALRELEKRD